MPIVFVMQGKCLFSDISRPVSQPGKVLGGNRRQNTSLLAWMQKADVFLKVADQDLQCLQAMMQDEA